MEWELSEAFDNLKKMWQTLSDGGLAIVDVGSEPIGFIRGKKLPTAVRNALRQGKTIDALKLKRGTWWVISPAISLPGRIQMVAWAARGEDWGDLLQTWTDLLAVSLGERAVADGLIEALVNAWDRLTFLYELTHIAGQVSDLTDMLASIVGLLAQVVTAEEVFIVTRNALGWMSVTASGRPLPTPATLVENVIGAEQPVGLEEIRSPLKQAGSPLARAGDLLVAPLLAESGFLGAIGFSDLRKSVFNSSDVLLLAAVAEQVGALVESRRTRAAREESRRLEHELAISADIQSSLLPVELPQISGIEMAARLKPARLIGGDFYDVEMAKTGEPVLLLADVAGKGSPAAILTAVVHATFRSEVSHWSDPAILLQVMSRLLYSDLDRAETFVTVVVVRLESNPLGFTYSSAGHVDVPLWRNGDQELKYLPATGLPLGIDPDATYKSRHVVLEPGDVLLLYSDGVTETENTDGKVLGLQGLSDIIYATYPAGVNDQIRVIVEALDVHRDSLPLRDDVALLIVRALPTDEAPVKVVPFVFPAEVTAASGLVTLVQEIGNTLPLDGIENRRHFADDFALAASEIVTNQITHAYKGKRGRIQGRIMIKADRLVADLFDNGIPFEPPTGSEPAIDSDNLPEKGYGLMMVRGLLDSFEYRRLDGGRNHWQLVKTFTGAKRQ